jgi:hypothetical protein
VFSPGHSDHLPFALTPRHKISPCALERALRLAPYLHRHESGDLGHLMFLADGFAQEQDGRDINVVAYFLSIFKKGTEPLLELTNYGRI